MNNKIAHFCHSLNSLNPEESDGLIADLYDLVDLIRDEKDISQVYDPIFCFFEKYPDADVGNPGPLVHLLERHYPRYMFALLTSLKRNPTYITVIMLSRVLGSELSVEKKESYLLVLKAVANSEIADEITKENAQETYNFHIIRNS